MAGLVRGAFFFALGVAAGVAAGRLWKRLSKDSGKEGTQLLIRGVGAALSVGREMTRKASRFMEEVEDMVAEAQAELDNAQANGSPSSAPRGTDAA